MTRLGYAIATTVAAETFAALFIGVSLIAPHPRLIWNASASAPIGLYRVATVDRPHIGDLVAVTPPNGLARLMAERRYLSVGVPLLKHVAALPGDRVCRSNGHIAIEGRPVAVARMTDSRGRPLPVWQGCHVVARDQLFLLNDATDSFDGRYFGAIPAKGLIGRATPILTRDAPGKPLHWRGFGVRSASRALSRGPSSCR